MQSERPKLYGVKILVFENLKADCNLLLKVKILRSKIYIVSSVDFRLLEVRGRLYELLTHCIPADVIMKVGFALHLMHALSCCYAVSDR